VNFEEFIVPVIPRLRQLAFKYRSVCSLCDENDLFEEMELFLLGQWQSGGLADKTESYVVQACYFHLRNFLRTAQEQQEPVHLDIPSAGEDNDKRPCLEEVLSDGEIMLERRIEGNILYETIMNNGFNPREKDIIRLLYEGFTVREIGKQLHLSHVMVLKIKRQIAEKVTKEYGFLLV
jgi:RNA polymerase sigma factor (sigma-70 family)